MFGFKWLRDLIKIPGAAPKSVSVTESVSCSFSCEVVEFNLVLVKVGWGVGLPSQVLISQSERPGWSFPHRTHEVRGRTGASHMLISLDGMLEFSFLKIYSFLSYYTTTTVSPSYSTPGSPSTFPLSTDPLLLHFCSESSRTTRAINGILHNKLQ